MKPRANGPRFVVIGETIHCSGVLRRDGPRVIRDPRSGQDAIHWTGRDGRPKLLPAPDGGDNRIMHIKVAVAAARGSDTQREAGLDYLDWRMRQQIDGGADYLDLNVDEISPDPLERGEAMAWLVGLMRRICPIALCLDSSSVEALREGLEAAGDRSSDAMLNSASIERPAVLDLARAHRCAVVVTAAAAGGLPRDGLARLDQATRMIDAALAKGIEPDKLFVDPLMLPIRGDLHAVTAVLEAIGLIRRRFGAAVRITGGYSNVSFGLPARRLINEVFATLAIEAGADSAIIDAAASNPRRALRADRAGEAFRLTETLLLGRDPNCARFIDAYRRGDLA